MLWSSLPEVDWWLPPAPFEWRPWLLLAAVLSRPCFSLALCLGLAPCNILWSRFSYPSRVAFFMAAGAVDPLLLPELSSELLSMALAAVLAMMGWMTRFSLDQSTCSKSRSESKLRKSAWVPSSIFKAIWVLPESSKMSRTSLISLQSDRVCGGSMRFVLETPPGPCKLAS